MARGHAVSGTLAIPTGEGLDPAELSPFEVHACWRDCVENLLDADGVRDRISQMQAFLGSEAMHALVLKAREIDPAVGVLDGTERSYQPHFNDRDYHQLKRAWARLPREPVDCVVLVPFGKLGGADLVAALLAHALARRYRSVILRTDLADWDRPDWYPDQVPAVDLSDILGSVESPTRALYAILQRLGAPRIFNVNSRLAFETFVAYGKQLRYQFRLFAYFFCADRDTNDTETGYPVWYFPPVFPHLEAALFDTRYLVATLRERYQISGDHAARLQTIYTPAVATIAASPIVLEQMASAPARSRPRILWAGRFDRQKRFDLLIAVARAMPDIDFEAWGKAVLDAPPDLSRIPGNLQVHPPFSTYDDLPLRQSDGWLYTAAWDGLPTLLIELGAMGVPIVASAVGGVPELIDRETGWLVEAVDDPQAYVAALHAMIDDPAARQTRARALQVRVATRHGQQSFNDTIAALCG